MFVKPVQAKNLHFNPYCLHFILSIKHDVQSYTLTACYPFKMNYFICNGGVGTAIQGNSCTQRHGNMLIM